MAFYGPRSDKGNLHSLGSTHAFGGFADTLRALDSRVAPGGLILALFWWKPPAAAYREVIGDEGFPPADTDYATGAQVGQDEGLTLLYAAASSHRRVGPL